MWVSAGCAPCEVLDVSGLDLAVASEVLLGSGDGSRRHGLSEAVVAWMEVEAVCLVGGGIGEPGDAWLAPLLAHPERQGRFGAWYVWSPDPKLLELEWATGASSCLGPDEGCAPAVGLPLEALGPWMTAPEWYEEVWLPEHPEPRPLDPLPGPEGLEP